MAEVMLAAGGGGRVGGGAGGGEKSPKAQQQQQQQLSVVALLLSALKKSVVTCRVDRGGGRELAPEGGRQMDIGWPTDVRHVTHVTFDRLNGYLGLPIEFELDSSDRLFGVAPEVMQRCYDSKGNIVPVVLLVLQERLYSQHGLKTEGIFRINPGNNQEEHVRQQLNKGVVLADVDVHCFASLIKAWFRELPKGILDGLSTEQLSQCKTESDYVKLVKLLLPAQAALLNWVVELMADVVEEEELNKMNVRNIATVFAPNMTQMSDPLTALMHTVQVMNLLQTLVSRSLRKREQIALEKYWSFSSSSPSYEQPIEGSDLRTSINSKSRRQISEIDRAICCRLNNVAIKDLRQDSRGNGCNSCWNNFGKESELMASGFTFLETISREKMEALLCISSTGAL